MSWSSRRRKQKIRDEQTPPPLTRHHKRCVSNGGDDSPDNVVLISDVKHRAFHTLFENMDAYGIAEKLNSIYIDSRYVLTVHKIGD